jgi:DnaJ-class molecular chaperone
MFGAARAAIKAQRKDEEATCADKSGATKTVKDTEFYDTLSVGSDSTKAQIKKAYHKLALELHPDRTAGDGAAAERFKEVSEAYQVLSVPELRAKYDEFGRAGLSDVVLLDSGVFFLMLFGRSVFAA